MRTGNCPFDNSIEDWAVVRLNEPVRNVTPYAIPEGDYTLKENEQIVQISNHHSNFKVGIEFPKTLETYQVVGIRPDTDDPVQHNCDTERAPPVAGSLL